MDGWWKEDVVEAVCKRWLGWDFAWDRGWGAGIHSGFWRSTLDRFLDPPAEEGWEIHGVIEAVINGLRILLASK